MVRGRYEQPIGNGLAYLRFVTVYVADMATMEEIARQVRGIEKIGEGTATLLGDDNRKL
jgi:translation elongation factor EF-1beta